MGETYYCKVGHKYVPIAEEKWWDSLPEGHHLISVTPGISSYKWQIHPDRAGLIAAVEEKRRVVQQVVSKAFEIRPVNRPVTPKQKEAWEAFIAAMGNDRFAVQYESIAGITDEILDVLTSV